MPLVNIKTYLLIDLDPDATHHIWNYPPDHCTDLLFIGELQRHPFATNTTT